jgi:hypothetical protein
MKRSNRARAEIVAEGRRLGAFLNPAATEADVRLVAS